MKTHFTLFVALIVMVTTSACEPDDIGPHGETSGNNILKKIHHQAIIKSYEPEIVLK